MGNEEEEREEKEKEEKSQKNEIKNRKLISHRNFIFLKSIVYLD